MSTRRNTSVNLLLAVLSTALLVQSTQADPINWRINLDAAKVEAGRTGKLILLHYYTASCGPCKKLERDVFSQPQIAALMERDFIPVKINADQSPALANAHKITRVPSEVILTSQGNIVQKLSCPLEPNDYGTQLTKVAQHYRGRSANRTVSAQAPVHSAYAGLKIGAPTVKAAPAASRTPLAPVVTTNPYINAAPPVAQQQLAAPAVPANAMPNSYGNRYAAVATPAPVARQAPITPTPTAQPVTPQVTAAPSIAAAPPIAKPTTPPAAATPPSVQQVAAAPAVVAPVAVEAWPPQLPAGTPPLAFDGYCPVSLQAAQKWVRGNKTFGAIHRGRTYLFASDAQRQKFLANPDAFSPVFSGNDPVKMLDENEQVAGSRKYGFAYRGAFYLFSSNETMQRFARQPDHYSAGVRQAMNRMDASAGGTVRR